MAGLLFGFLVLGLVVIVCAGAIATAWYQAGMAPVEAVSWMRAGFGRRAAAAWRAVPTAATPDVAVVWERAGLTPQDARWCAEHGITAETALAVAMQWTGVGLAFDVSARWAGLGFGPQDYQSWAVHPGPDGKPITPEEVSAWRGLRVGPADAVEWFEAGIAPGDHIPWLDAACDAVTAGTLQRARVDPRSAQAWLSNVDAGEVAQWTRWLGDRPVAAAGWIGQEFVAAEAARWHSLGFVAEEAREWCRAGFGPVAITARWRELFIEPAIALEWVEVSPEPSEAAEYRDVALAPQEAAAWLLHGITAADVGGWSDLGFTPDAAAAWTSSGFLAAEAANWRDSNFDPVPAGAWREAGLSTDDAQVWRGAGFEPLVAGRWQAEGVEPDLATDWRASIPALDDAIGWRRQGFEPSTAAAWIGLLGDPGIARTFYDSGFNPERSAEWVQLGLAANAADRWRAVGFEPPLAAPWLAAGLEPTEARVWNDADWSAADAAAWKAAEFECTDATEWQAAAGSLDRAVAFRGMGFAPEVPADRAWMQSTLEPHTASAWRQHGLTPESADQPLAQAMAALPLQGQAALLSDLIDERTREDTEGLHAIADWDGSQPDLIFCLAAIVGRHPGAGAAQANMEAAGIAAAPGLRPADLTAAGPAAFDDFLENGSRPNEFLEETALQLNAAGDPYALARLRPDLLDETQLESLDHHDELARRAYLAADHADLSGFPTTDFITQLIQMADVLGGNFETWRANPPTPAAAIAAVGPRSPNDLQALASDPTVWSLVASQVASFVAASEDPPDLQEQAAELAVWSLATVTRKHLRTWRWPEAESTSALWAELAPTATGKAEALNCRAAAAFLVGDERGAKLHLEAAMAVHRHPSLHVNQAVLLAERNPAGSIEALAAGSRLAKGTEAVELGLAAMKRYFDGDEHPYGPELRAALRRIAPKPMPIDEHHLLMELLVRMDKDWVAQPANTRKSPHVSSWEHQVPIAEATGLMEYITCLGRAATDPHAPSWVDRERHHLVQQVVMAMEDDSSDAVAAPAIAIHMVEHDFFDNPAQRAAVLCFAVRQIFASFDLGEDDPADALADALVSARTALDHATAEERAELREEIDRCLDLFVILRRECIRATLKKAADIHDTLVAKFRASGGGWSARRSLRSDAGQLTGPVTDLESQLRRALGFASDHEIRSDTRELADAAGELRRSLEEMAS